MSARPFLIQVKSDVEEGLRSFFQSKREETQAGSERSLELLDAVADLTLRGGKRFRPAMLTAGYLATSANPEMSRTITPGVALELLQTYLLIHDDWIDQDEERRGGTAVHTLFAQRTGDAHLGASMAILAGDMAGAYAWEVLLTSDFPDVAAAQRVFTQIHREVFWGQLLDIVKDPDVDRMHDLKTGSYTVRGPLLLGAALGGASEAQQEALLRFAHPLGLAFQQRDDLIGTFGDTKDTGKPKGSDLRAGKHNAILAAAETRLSSDQRARLSSLLADPTDSAVTEAMALIESSGVRAEVEANVRANLAAATGALDGAPLEPRGLELLRGLADMLSVREH